MRVLAFPRSTADPYQDLLYGALAGEGFEVTYLPMATRSQTLGYRIVWTAHNLLPHAKVLADDLAGRRYEPDDPAARRKVLGDVARMDPGRLAAMGAAGRRSMAGRSWAACARATAALYREALS